MRSLVGRLAVVSLLVAGSPARAEVLVAAAANLATVLRPIAEAFTAETGVRAVPTFASTGALARQLERGAPFDLFLAADTATVDALVAEGVLDGATRRVFARGTLVLWSAPDARFVPAELADLRDPHLGRIAIANPAVAPYGAAARAVLYASGLWEELQPRLVIAQNVADARRIAATGNADAAFVAWSLVIGEPGSVLTVDASLHPPLDHAMAVVTASSAREDARRFATYLLGAEARRRLAAAGYTVPSP